MKPRPKLFAALLAVFAVWVAFLVWMYFATVGERGSDPSPVQLEWRPG